MAKIGSFLFLALTSSLALAEGRITVAVSPNPIAEMDQTQLRIQIVSTGADRIESPRFDAPDFTLIGQSGGSSQYSVTMVNGRMTQQRSITFAYVLSPKKPGMLYIKNISAKVGNETVRSEDIGVKVESSSSGGQNNSPSEDDSNPAAPKNFAYGGGSAPQTAGSKNYPSTLNSDFTIFASIDKNKAYVGELIYVEYYIYDFGGIREAPEIMKWPAFNGFWKEDIELVSRLQFDVVEIGNQRVRRALLGRYAIYGIKPGKFEMDKLQVRARVLSRNTRGNDDDFPFSLMFGGSFRTGTHASQDVKLEIIPVPTENKPADFGGAVGQFTVRLEADKTSIAANNPINFKLFVEGIGNFQAIEAFKLPLPQDFELYESSNTYKPATFNGFRKATNGMKTFQYIAIPRKAGAFQIPPIQWSYFDPEKKEYKTISTQKIELSIQEGTQDATNNSYLNPLATNTPQSTPKLNEELRYLKPDASRSFSLPTFLKFGSLLLVLINLALGAVLYGRKMPGLLKRFRRENPFEALKRDLSKITSLGKGELIHDLEVIIFKGIQTMIGENPRGLTRIELENIWKQKALPVALFQKTDALLDSIDKARFATQAAKSADSSLRSKLISDTENFLDMAGNAYALKK